MASLAPTPAYEEHPRRQRPPSRKPAVRQQRRMAGSVVWICIVGVLLAGVVAVNVAVLRLNLRLDQLTRDRAKLQADIAAQQLQLAGAATAGRIEQAAALHGLAPADPRNITYVSVAPGAK
jgi:Tfp pilus assembly protein PilN